MSWNCIELDCQSCEWAYLEGGLLYCNYNNRLKKSTVKPTEMIDQLKLLEAKLKEFLEAKGLTKGAEKSE